MERIAPRNLYCEECSLQFENKLLFDLHISLKHRKRIQGAKVPEIYKEKSPKPQTKKKSISDHVIPGKPYNFETINSAISLHESKSSLKIHNESNSRKKKLFKCSSCEGSFTSKQHLENHNKTEHKKEKSVECKICRRVFSRKQDLKTHVFSVHDKKKPFECNICDAKFASKVALTKHISSIHEGIEHKCTTCNVS